MFVLFPQSLQPLLLPPLPLLFQLLLLLPLLEVMAKLLLVLLREALLLLLVVLEKYLLLELLVLLQLENLLLEVLGVKPRVEVETLVHVVEVVASGHQRTVHGRFTGHVFVGQVREHR